MKRQKRSTLLQSIRDALSVSYNIWSRIMGQIGHQIHVGLCHLKLRNYNAAPK